MFSEYCDVVHSFSDWELAKQPIDKGDAPATALGAVGKAQGFGSGPFIKFGMVMDSKKPFYKSALFWGIICSFAYLGSIAWLLGWDRIRCLFATEGLNNIGDFMAGVFGPLSIGWVVLGYWQNQDALSKQAGELANAVKAANQHLQVERRKVDPDLYLTDLKVIRFENPSENKDSVLKAFDADGKPLMEPIPWGDDPDEKRTVRFALTIRNAGAYAQNFDVCLGADQSFLPMARWPVDALKTFGSLESQMSNSFTIRVCLSEVDDNSFIRDIYNAIERSFYVSLAWDRDSENRGSVIYKIEPDSSSYDQTPDYAEGFEETCIIKTIPHSTAE
jgi:hypothetical protein